MLEVGFPGWGPGVVWFLPAGGVEGEEPVIVFTGVTGAPLIELRPAGIEEKGGVAETRGVGGIGGGMAETGGLVAGEAVAGGLGAEAGRLKSPLLVRRVGVGADADDEVGGIELDFEPPGEGGLESQVDVVPEDGGIEVLFGRGSGDDA